MDIGEAVAVLTSQDTKCPFCTAKEPDPEKGELKLVNDSSELARKMGGMPKKLTPNPEAQDDYYIYESSWQSDAESWITFNAHHVIPGNASLRECPELRKWMAAKQVFEKRFYDESINELVKQVPKAQQDQKRAQLVEAKHGTRYVDSQHKVIYSTKAGRSGIHAANTVAKDYVVGKVDYSVNNANNGIWLPSNNAIHGWSGSKNVSAKDKDGSTRSLGEAYAYNTMKVTDRQFHDAHPTYSKNVIKKLLKLQCELLKCAIRCKSHDDSPGGPPYRAPTVLPSALDRLSKVIAKQLDLTVTPKPPKAWTTSDYVNKVL